MNWGVGQLVAVSWDAPYNKTYEKLSKDEGGLYRSPYPLQTIGCWYRMLRGETLVFTGLTARMVVRGSWYTTTRVERSSTSPIYVKYKPVDQHLYGRKELWCDDRDVSAHLTKVKVEGYPHSWATMDLL